MAAEGTARPSVTQTRSHAGRGGMGNVSLQGREVTDVKDLSTPHIRANTFTTGRGGAGNMSKSDPSNPAATRAAQDVDTPAHHNKSMQGTYHWGRGGEGNMMSVGGGGGGDKAQDSGLTRVKSREEKKSNERTSRSGSFKEVMDKGREMLGLGGKKERAAASERAGENAFD
ncbi:uncharacterized protein RCC_03984 [Ramularia collo-cygni]|uniref:Uncharacterized protein n=1 Tax=Ramularia collo-cygni TaxID=112498 RepID=A0A2D3V6I9_9PEZI|nr:uncharacterized protein RCC_03984 [Ramularia collo-cygni]CZT18144.1 uncharacterized protein RCC_03984 [Ramularia collo-cygni]